MKLQLDLLCFCLLCFTGKTLYDEKGPVAIKVLVSEGSDVTLPCSLSTKENIEQKLFDWRKHDGMTGVFKYDKGLHYNNGGSGQDEQFKGRVFHFQDELKHGNASIIIRTTKMADSGDYTCFFPLLQTHQIFHIDLVVGPAAIKVLVSEGSDVTLPCSLSTKENIQQKLFDWRKDDGMTGVFMYDKGLHHNNGGSGQDEQFKGRVFHFQDELKHGNASIIIRTTKMADSGDYTCDFPLLQTPQIFHIDLVVVSSPKPSVTVLKGTYHWKQLQCEIRGASPKPKVEWKDSDGNILPAEEPQVTDRGGSYDIILQTTVTRTDRYHCVVTQEEINHQIHTEISVDIIDETWSNILLWLVVAATSACIGLDVVWSFWWNCGHNDRIDRGAQQQD